MKLSSKAAKTLLSLSLTTLIMAGSPQVQAEDAGLQVGVLKCKTVPGSRVNLIVRSTADVECEYDNQGTIEKYVGETGIGFGLDLSFKSDEEMHFAVVAASADITPGAYALAGRYAGGELNAAAGIGLGAKGLVSVANSSFGLQPLAINTSKGLGVSGGLSFLYIEAAK